MTHSCSDYVQQYADNNLEHALLQQTAKDPAALFLINQAANCDHVQTLLSRESTLLSKYVHATVSTYATFHKCHDRFRERKADYKAFILERINTGSFSEDVHYSRLPGASLRTGNNIMLTSVGKDVALSQGVFGRDALSTAYATLTSPELYDLCFTLIECYKKHLLEWGAARATNKRAFNDLKNAVLTTIPHDPLSHGEAEEAKKAAQAKTMRYDKTMYTSFFHPEPDTKRGGMTGQLVLVKNLAAADAPPDEWKKAMKEAKKNTLSKQLSRLGQARQELMRAEMDDMHSDNPHSDMSHIANVVTTRAIDEQRNLSRDIGGNLFPPDVQRRKNFNHAAGLPPPDALLRALTAPLTLPAPNAAA